MGPIWLVRMARMARRPPPLWKILLVLGVVGLAALIIGAEWLFGIELLERDTIWRRGPAIEVAK
ncbi:MAG: hypothetical protein MK180_09910 [Rhodobacteraceae bacterium]|nr:hypothetical protein [Paracoccaceae bacterium]